MTEKGSEEFFDFCSRHMSMKMWQGMGWGGRGWEGSTDQMHNNRCTVRSRYSISRIGVLRADIQVRQFGLASACGVMV